jgi:hypothetical protein
MDSIASRSPVIDQLDFFGRWMRMIAFCSPSYEGWRPFGRM